MVLIALAAVVLTTPFLSVYAAASYGDGNVEPVQTTLIQNYVDALTKFTTAGTTITSVSLYLYYTLSDGSQCLKFGIYRDNGGLYGQSSPDNEPLVAATSQGYCFQAGNFGPAWETWTLVPSDQMSLGAGTYWLAVLAE